jgi:tetratricopeptide (TPR) repeat protein
MLTKKRIILILGTLALLALGLLAWPNLHALRLRAEAGRLLDEYIRTHAGEYQDHFVCLLPLLTDLPADPRLAEAIALLEKAREVQPAQAHTHFLLGRAYCLVGEFPAAAEALEAYVEIRPDNPMGQLSLSFAHFSWGNLAEDLTEAEKLSVLDQTLLHLESIGFSRDAFLSVADKTFAERNFQVSWLWYSISNTFRALDGESEYRRMVLEALYWQKTTINADIDDELFLVIDNEPITIPPSHFYRLQNGEKLPIKKFESNEIGILLSKYEDARLLLYVLGDGCYQLTINLVDSAPPPTHIDLSIDFRIISEIILSTGTDSWETIKKDVNLDSGFHLIGFQLMNDTKFDGLDRNGHLGTVSIAPCSYYK